ncbi:MAG TPA: GNAT family N-acetyltransferase [Haliangium sp.]|nr:GNAT family N-acetyltransferase [Haliangium sp.]
MPDVHYHHDRKIDAREFIDVLRRSTLDRRRPVHDEARIQRMLDQADVLITAWSSDLLVGVSRALSDFAYCCYLSDLAVDQSRQRQGIGKRLIEETHRVAGEQTTLILLAAPAAASYYPHIGMERFTDCFLIREKA